MLLGVLAMAVIVTASNILVQYPINDWLTWGAFSYPVSFLVTDLTNRRLGPSVARRVVYVGFALALGLSWYFATPRIAVAAAAAGPAAPRHDKLVDTALFFSIAFAGTALPWISLGLGDFAVKVAMALVMLVPFRALMPALLPFRPAER
jgi:uncharacterized PurR-regulated membrane protein YhhQ (DUF165 family)